MEEQKQEASEDVDMVDTSQLATSNGAGDLSPGGPDNSISPGGPDNSISPGGADNSIPPGGAGNSIPPGGAGNSISPGGAGNSLSPGGAGNSLSPGGAGNSLSPGGAGNSISPGGAGNSISPGGAANSIPPGGAGNSISPGGADKSISPGGAGNSIPPGGADNSIPPGGAGNSIPPGGAGNSIPPGGAGNSISPGGAGNSMPPGGAGNSSSRGGAANSLLSGGADKRQGESAMEPNSKDENFSSGPAPDVNMNGGDPVSGPAPDVNMNEEDPVSGPALAGASCPTTSSEQYAPGGKTQEPPELSQKPGSQDRAGTAGGGGAEAVVGGSSREEKQPGQNTEITKRQRMETLGIFLTDLKTDYFWLTDYLCKISTIVRHYIVPFSVDSWDDVIDRTSFHIIVHSMRSEKSQHDLKSLLDHFIKCSQPVKVLITDVTDKDSEMKRFWASQTETNKWESLSFTEAELDFIKKDRLKPWTDRDTESKLKRMRDILRKY
ncbi:Hypothetical predicted protein [Pelobates cultripes]|uniref:Uncharacterized protein n=1 Tax=Pelobates cultripes TaxID=61616 RepID=A0AAD1SS73_PELCU|nr:Hypothetical predicted protein [Pelobates cultripes]